MTNLPVVPLLAHVRPVNPMFAPIIFVQTYSMISHVLLVDSPLKRLHGSAVPNKNGYLTMVIGPISQLIGVSTMVMS